MNNYSWQEKAIEAHTANNYNGLVIAVTGAGKTRCALNIFKILKQKTLIVVPTIALLNQWVEELQKIGVKSNDIGTYYGSNKTIRPVTVAVINSAATRNDWSKEFSFLIVDEVHRVNESTTEFQKLLLNNTFKYNLGLTATIDTTDPNYKIILQKIGKVVYEYTTANAKEDELINSFTIRVIGLDLTENKKKELEEIEVKIKEKMKDFGDDLNIVLAQQKIGDWSAMHTLKLMQKKKSILNRSEEKMEAALQLILKNRDKKIIVFGEFAVLAEVLFKKLQKLGVPSWIYHSKTKHNNSEKKVFLDEFKNSIGGVLVTVKALDEGLNVPDASMAIVLGYNGTARQAIQRMGRILRKQENKHPVMVIFYFKGTSDVYYANNFCRKFSGLADIVWEK